MSGYTQTSAELLYSYYGAATTTTPTASPGSSMILTYPPIVIPANYFSKLGAQSSSMKLKMGGLATVTATIPTWQFFLYLTTTNAFGQTLTLGSTATFTPGQGATNAVWDADIDIGLRALALGSSSTIVAIGKYTSEAFTPAAYSATIYNTVTMPAIGAYTPLATYQTDIQYYLWPALSLGAGTAGNTVTTEYVKLYGEN
jgi:hypothetical protein